MRIGVGLPAAIAGAPAQLTAPWARAAEVGPFSCVGVHDRLAYDSLEPLAALAAAAAVTQRVDLACLVGIAPLRNTALLARQAATLEALSGGRLVLGLGVGPRRADYDAAGVPYARRGAIMDDQLWELRPRRLLVGGASAAALTRLGRHAAGFVHGGGPPRAFRAAAERALIAWSDAGRAGRPELWGLGYFALGPGAAGRGREDLGRYYAFAGGLGDRVADGLLTTPDEVRGVALAYADAGCTDLVLFPTVPELEQVDRLAEAVGAFE